MESRVLLSHRQQHHSTPTSSSSGEWSHPPSLMTNRPRLEKNHLNENPADGGTDAGTFDDITQPENGIQSSLSRETRSRFYDKDLKKIVTTEGKPFIF